MMVKTTKLKKRNLWLALAIVAAVLLIIFLPAKETESIETNEQRIAFLADFGWEVKDSPAQSQELRIPEEQDEVFSRYNELQKSQGYDLSAYAGKCVWQYVYEITNYPEDDAAYYATILMDGGQVIGGHIASSEQDGPMHGFAMPNHTTEN